jgi:hypothetical protein
VIFLWLVAFVVLTALTQIGGVVLILATLAVRLALPNVTGWRRQISVIAIFLAAYVAATTLAVPRLAAIGGRVPLPCAADSERPLVAASPAFCLLNRNYVVADLARLADALSRDLDKIYPGTVTLFLDASFPFVVGFPLLPHLSHDDGRKLDLALWYRMPGGGYLPGILRSPIGYGALEQPRPEDPQPCEPGRIFTLRWDLALLQPAFRQLALDEDRTRAALEWLFGEGMRFGVERVFIEPHLATRLAAKSPVLGFQGCRAARHDDHIHVEIAGETAPSR